MQAISPNSLFHLVCRAFERLLGQNAVGDIEFMNTFRAYYDWEGNFSAEVMWLPDIAQSYAKAVSDSHIFGLAC